MVCLFVVRANSRDGILRWAPAARGSDRRHHTTELSNWGLAPRVGAFILYILAHGLQGGLGRLDGHKARNKNIKEEVVSFFRTLSKQLTTISPDLTLFSAGLEQGLPGLNAQCYETACRVICAAQLS